MPATRPGNLLLTFDAFGTLFTPRFTIAAQYAFVAQAHGLAGLKEADIQGAFKRAFKEESRKNPNFGKNSGMNPNEWWTRIITKIFTSVTSSPLPPSLAPALIHHFASDKGYTLYPEVIPLLRTLRSPPSNWPYTSTTIGVITNSDSRVTPILNALGVGVQSYQPTIPSQSRAKEEGVGKTALLDFVTLSYDIGHEKPDARIFDAAKRIGMGRVGGGKGCWRFLHVGDDRVKDYEGAKKAGWEALLVDRTVGKDRVAKKDVVKGLDEVLEVLLDTEQGAGTT